MQYSAERLRRMESVVAAARTGNADLIRLALEYLDRGDHAAAGASSPDELSERLKGILARELGPDAERWADTLATMTPREVLAWTNFGRKYFNELQGWLASMDMRVGCRLPDASVDA